MQTNSNEFRSLFPANYRLKTETIFQLNETKCHELSLMQTKIQTERKYDLTKIQINQNRN